MKYIYDTKKISKEDFMKLKEDDLMFITNPGRMGDVDGSTFVIMNNSNYIAYRVGGWYCGERDDNFISLDDMFKIFPKWRECLDNLDKENYKGKYTYIYMGFGNGLCVDNRIYDKYYPYLLEEVKKQEMYSKEDKDDYNPCLNYPSWEPALEKMINDEL